jgi:lysophospholipase
MSFVHVPGNPPPWGAEALWLEGDRKLQFRACLTPGPGAGSRGSVILFPGYTEYLEKYFETATDLQKRGFASFVMDWRGQGLSSRLVRNPHIMHFDRFDDPVRDIAAAVRHLESRLPKPWVLLAHSMGGGIALRGLATGQLEAKAAMFSAPMWGLKANTFLNRVFARDMRSIGLGRLPTSIVPKKPRQEAFEGNPVTSDPERFARNQAIWLAESGVRIAGPTFGWFAAACDVVRDFKKGKGLDQVWLPVTVCSAEDERLVLNECHAGVAAKLQNAQHIVIPGAKHELLQEADPIRDQFLAAFDALLERAGV